MTDFKGLLETLRRGGVEFILVGGLAARAHGASRSTQDVAIVYERSEANLKRLQASLEPSHPYLRGAPPGLPFRWDVQTLKAGLNFTLTTSLGAIDLLGEITGGGSYEQLYGSSFTLEIFGLEVRCLSITKLIETKRAAGRPRDFEAIAELELIQGERNVDDAPPKG